MSLLGGFRLYVGLRVGVSMCENCEIWPWFFVSGRYFFAKKFLITGSANVPKFECSLLMVASKVVKIDDHPSRDSALLLDNGHFPSSRFANTGYK